MLLAREMLTGFSRKGDTLSEILSLLRRVNSNVDNIASRGLNDGESTGQHPVQRNIIISPDNDTTEADKTFQLQPSDSIIPPQDNEVSLVPGYYHSTAAHRLMEWPFIYQQLQNLPLSTRIISPGNGVDWFLSVYSDQTSIPLSADETFPETTNPVSALRGIPYGDIVMWVDMYFDTFNFIHPLLDRSLFFQETLPIATNTKTVVKPDTARKNIMLALLVIALGQMALEGTIGKKKITEKEVDQGYEHPPGLVYFNEVRKRIGFVEGDCGLEVVQILALTS